MKTNEFKAVGKVVKVFPIITTANGSSRRQILIDLLHGRPGQKIICTIYDEDIDVVDEGDLIKVTLLPDAKQSFKDPNLWIMYLNAKHIEVLENHGQD
jgi:hypothetical protein